MARRTTEAAATSKSGAKRTITRRRKSETAVLSEEHVATRAYYIHLDTGGDPVENWLQAERELATA